IGPAAQRREQLALRCNTVSHRPVFGKEVSAARLVEAALQFRTCAVEEQGADHDIFAPFQLVDAFHHLIWNEAARAAVEAYCERMLLWIVPDQAREEADREVVERFPAKVFQLAKRGGLAGSEHPGDQHDTLPLVYGIVRH